MDIQNSSLHSRDNHSVTPIHLASKLPTSRVLKLLLQHLPTDCNTPLDFDGRSPLHYSAEAGSIACFHTLLSLPWHLPIDQRDKNGMTPLMYAVAESLSTPERDEIVRLLVTKKPISVGMRCRMRGMSAVHLAVLANNLSALGILLGVAGGGGEGCDTTGGYYDSEQRTPLHYAALHGRAEAVELLMRHGGLTNDARSLLILAWNVDFKFFSRDSHNVPPAHYAAQGGDFDTLMAIARHGRPLDSPLDDDRRTPFMWAVVFQRMELVGRMLAERSLWINRLQRDGHHYTALHLAALTGNRDICRALIEEGFSPLERDLYEATPEHLAAGQGHYDALVYFAYKRAGPGQLPLDEAGRSPLGYACLGGQAYAVETMLQGQPSLDLAQVDSTGRSVLHCAVMAESLACVEVLVKVGGLMCWKVVRTGFSTGSTQLSRTLRE